MRTFLVTAERTPRGWWVLESPDVGAVSQVRRLDQAADEMREAIAHLAGLAEHEVDIEVRPVLPSDFTDALAEARVKRAVADEAAAAASESMRRAVRVLDDRGLSVRDIGGLVGLSHQRVSRLLAS